ncbi:MAG: sulfurtransferase [Chloroflexi bacterium]|nr:sulfurtransferase [Chloroflexota bacterium]
MNSPLVSTEWLAAHLHEVRVIDIRGHVVAASEPLPHYFNHHADYLVSHIPGALFVDWVHEITDPADPRHALIAQPERYAAAMSRLGIGQDTFVVTYDDANSMFAARLWWSLLYYGHEKVAVLDGGWHKWTREGRPVSTEIPTIAPAAFVPRVNAALRVNADQVAALSAESRLIDVRTVEEFTGKSSRARRKGHIPGARSLPRMELVAQDGTLPTPERLRAQFGAVGVDEGTENTVFYCNAGVSASYGLLALRVAGFDGAVYDGSWKDWGNDETRPVE